jgi:PleD family two-component response regulator
LGIDAATEVRLKELDAILRNRSTIPTDYYKNQLISLLEKDNFTDEITGLKNHKALKSHLKKTIEELLNTSKIATLSIILIDIDDFKEYNTKYGHTKADKILKSLGLKSFLIGK